MTLAYCTYGETARRGSAVRIDVELEMRRQDRYRFYNRFIVLNFMEYILESRTKSKVIMEATLKLCIFPAVTIGSEHMLLLARL